MPSVYVDGNAVATKRTPTPRKEEREVPMNYSEVEVKREGTQVVLPPNMSYDEAIAWMERKRDEDEQVVSINEAFDCFPFDGAHALMLALRQKFGWTSMIPTPGFFGTKNPPAMMAVRVGPDTTVQVPWGRMQIPGVDGWLQTQYRYSSGQLTFAITAQVKQKHRHTVQQITQLVRDFLATDSIYRGKALRVNLRDFNPENDDPMALSPEFMDTKDTKQYELVFPAETRDVIQDALFTPIENADACRAAHIPLKRGILLEGPYGVGKTMTAAVTAAKCVRNGWTFIYLHSVEQLSRAVNFAKQYGPAVIFAEDVDRVVSGPRDTALDAILNVIDGVDTKGVEVITVLTTNHIEKINRALLRPGRIDAVVSVRPPDAEAVRTLLRMYGRGLVDSNTDLERVGEALAGQIPAVIREVVERAKLTSISRHANDARGVTITEEDLLRASRGMLDQVALVNAPIRREPTATEAFATDLANRFFATLELLRKNPTARQVDVDIYTSNDNYLGGFGNSEEAQKVLKASGFSVE